MYSMAANIVAQDTNYTRQRDSGKGVFVLLALLRVGKLVGQSLMTM